MKLSSCQYAMLSANDIISVQPLHLCADSLCDLVNRTPQVPFTHFDNRPRAYTEVTPSGAKITYNEWTLK